MKTTKTIVIETTQCDRCKKDVPDGERAVAAALQVGDFKIEADDLCVKCATAVLNGIKRLKLDGRETAEQPSTDGEPAPAAPQVDPIEAEAEEADADGGANNEPAPDSAGESFQPEPTPAPDGPDAVAAEQRPASFANGLDLSDPNDAWAAVIEYLEALLQPGQDWRLEPARRRLLGTGSAIARMWVEGIDGSDEAILNHARRLAGDACARNMSIYDITRRALAEPVTGERICAEIGRLRGGGDPVPGNRLVEINARIAKLQEIIAQAREKEHNASAFTRELSQLEGERDALTERAQPRPAAISAPAGVGKLNFRPGDFMPAVPPAPLFDGAASIDDLDIPF